MFRIHEYQDFLMLAVRKHGVPVKFYMNSLFKWTRILMRNKYVPSLKQLGYARNEDYTDWVPFNELPNHVPEFQWFTYYKVMWEKRKNEI